MDAYLQKQRWFTDIYHNHQSTLLSWFKHKLQHHHQSEDLSQEVFLRALKSQYNFTEIKEPQAWLMGIAKHVIIDHWRRQRVERLYLEALSQLPEYFAPSAEHEVCIRETLYQLYQMLEQIPTRAAQVFLMSQLDGLSYRLIGETLQISEATVKRDMKLAFTACLRVYHDASH